MNEKDKEYLINSFEYFKQQFLTDVEHYDYKSNDKGMRFKLPKSLFDRLSNKLKEDSYKFEVIPAEKKMIVHFPRHNGKKLLKTKPFEFLIYFVEDNALKPEEKIQKTTDKNIKDWVSFFEMVEPEYKNTMKKIIDKIVIAEHKNEYNKVISKKTYFLDFNEGLFERKEKLVNDEWVVSYQPVTKDLYNVFRIIFKFFEKIPLNELASIEKFKEILSKTKYRKHVEKLG